MRTSWQHHRHFTATSQTSKHIHTLGLHHEHFMATSQTFHNYNTHTCTHFTATTHTLRQHHSHFMETSQTLHSYITHNSWQQCTDLMLLHTYTFHWDITCTSVQQLMHTSHTLLGCIKWQHHPQFTAITHFTATSHRLQRTSHTLYGNTNCTSRKHVLWCCHKVWLMLWWTLNKDYKGCRGNRYHE